MRRKPDTAGAGNSDAVLARLRRPLALTRAGLAAERAARAFWPVWSLLCVAAAAWATGVPGAVPLSALIGLALTWAALTLWGLYAGLRRFSWPGRAAALDRLDRSLDGQPIAALTDTQAIGAGDPASAAVWRAHRERMAARVAAVRPVAPDLRLARRDAFGLRYMALGALAVGLIFGGPWRPEVLPSGTGPGAAIAAGPAYEGWIQPPGYTGKPTIYLNEAEGRDDLTVPHGSRVTLRLYGAVGALTLEESVSGRPAEGRDPTAPVQEFDVTQDGRIAIDGAREQGWDIEMLPDAPPEVAQTEPVNGGLRGQMTLKFRAADDYGVETGTVRIALDLGAVDRRHGLAAAPEPRAPVVLDLPMPFGGDRTEFEDQLVEDLSQHPWAGLPVRMTLAAEDAAGQEGRSAPVEMILPARRFLEPMAAALAEQRRDLLWSRENARRVAQVIRAVTHRPEGVFENTAAYLLVRMALRRLEAATPGGLAEAPRDEVAEMLWHAALMIEEGDLSDALERLRRAQDRLSEAIEQGASDEEIAELMDELREAMQDYMEQMAREALENPDSQMSENQQQGQQITQDQLQQLLDRIEELSRQGRTAEAQALLDQLRQMMENMRMTQGQGQNPGEQAMQGLQDTLREQQGLSDEAFRELQEQFNRGAQAGESRENEGRSGGQGRGQSHEGQGGRQGQSGPGEGGEPGAAELAERQRALREMLREQQQGLPGAGTPQGDAAREELDRAGRAMDRAGDDLAEGDLSGALDNQAEAMQALRDGMQELGEAMARQQPGQGQQGERFGSGNPRDRDPLGRRSGNTGRIGSDRNMLPGKDVFQRSRELLDEIRRRSGDRTRPELELDYLERLLDRF
ncbi:TIGR02302 family protein [Maritimibacter sp. 55A14]|uniref:TIGR02302 family protein n=1 Tax=Maritimibacter sp. 55A14 TaxID=2174844 RepID=UPI000D6135D7|nr:TIGR02302 family protein [Maritimibacter sp. 55A14]PWE32478.1 TIGR02302 family protein [Maritimibacter sp. 55A14]